MIVGFKTGPKTWDEGKKIVEEDGATMCEVWFNVSDLADYKQPLDWFLKRNVKLGLHYWGMVEDGLLANVATHHKEIRRKSIKQIKDTIDYAASIGAVYVNIHPGHRRLDKVEFDPILRFDLASGEATKQSEAEKLMLEAGLELSAYAKAKETILMVETITKFMQHAPGTGSRDDNYDAGPMGLSVIQQLAEAGVLIGNDISHTTASLPLEAPDKESMWRGLIEFTKQIQDQTRLLHINTVQPPYNGTDSHDGILKKDFADGVFPNQKQLTELLALFADRDDVYAVPEPFNDMQGNYQALVKMVEGL